MTEVYLKCVKEGSKLRIKIVSPGFHNEANCQFPRDIRVENRKFSVPRHAISFAEGPNHKFFYRISKSYIKIVEEDSIEFSSTISKIFEDTAVTDCMICMDREKVIVFAQCGHYICCLECSETLFKTTQKCPVCRSLINSLVKREDVQI